MTRNFISFLKPATTVLLLVTLLTLHQGLFVSKTSASRLLRSKSGLSRNPSPLAAAACPGPGLLISEILSNPPGTDSPFEFVELRATRAINFAATPYSVVVSNNGTATAAGWIAGGALSYGFSITTGAVNTGDVVYVGGSSMTPTGPKLRTINTGTTAGDGFGAAAAAGVFGNGGTNADGVAVFDVAVNGISNSTVPVDAIFYGSAIGSAVVSGGTTGYQLPVNDRYSGGKLQTTSFLAPDPGSGDYTVAAGTYDLGTCAFTTARTWASSTTLTDGTSSVSLTVPNAPTISENTASPLINLAAANAGFASGVIGDPADPLTTRGADFTINDADTAINALTVTATSSNQSVVPAANLTLTGSGTSARNLKIAPAAAGYSTVTVSVSDGTSAVAYTINYAASAPASTMAATRWHTGRADASTAIAVDNNLMFVADDEDQNLRLYDRANSGYFFNSFDFTSSLALTDFNNGLPREVDLEASAQIGNRVYWLGSHSNAATGAARPNRARLFATDLSGSGANAALSYVGRYDNLKTDLLNWDSTNAHGLGANYFGLAASAATGVIPETSDGSGFNIEGLTFAPDETTAYVSFRAPTVPANNRTKALIVPVTNFASLVTGNPGGGPAAFGTPIQLNLGGRGIREIKKNSANEYLIVAGAVDSTANFALYSWTGNAADAPVQRSANLAGLNPEAVVDLPVGLNAAASQPAAVSVQLLSDNGDEVYYNDGIAAKDLANNEFKKFRSDPVTVGLAPTAAGVSLAGRITSFRGAGVAGARVTVTNAATGEITTAATNAFGNFQISDLRAGATYLIEVKSKRYVFSAQAVTLTQNAADFRIIAAP